MPKPPTARVKDFEEVAVVSPADSSTKKLCNFDEEKEDAKR